MMETIFDLSARENSGKEKNLADYAGKVLLVVNTASKCGFTPQYKGLEDLYEKYADRGLVVLGFPCDQFAHQEPGSNEEIASFCQKNFGVTFPLMEKIDVNGPSTHPVFQFLKGRAPGVLGRKVKWNFTKFLVHRDGRMVKRFSPNTPPEALVRDVETAIAE
ncbi:MAG TPA: glutathione peroxidase [Spirochaetia bacterium]